MFNHDGVRYIHKRTRRLDVDSMDRAEEVLAAAIAKGPPSGQTPEKWARHLAWVIGFDTLLDERYEIHKITSLLVTEVKK